MACPETGSFIGYKIVSKYIWFKDEVSALCILKLEIPEDAKRSSSIGKKCRCDKAKVLRAYDYIKYSETNDLRKSIVAKKEADTFYSKFDPKFRYYTGKTVSVDNFDDDRWNECSSGIHFFMTMEEAVEVCSFIALQNRIESKKGKL